VNFPIGYYAAAFAAAAVTSWLALPLWRRWSRHVGLVDDPGHRKIHVEPMPLAGGLAVMTGLALPLMVAVLIVSLGWINADSLEPLTYGLGKRALQLAAIVGGGIGMLLLGLLDDRFELKPAAKFGGQLLIAFLVAASGVRVTLFVDNAAFSYAVTMLWILTVTNAVNFMDNMNGLCGGIGAIGAMYFALQAAAKGQYLVALLAFLAAGSLTGFLPHNYPRATSFLGDSGSHLVGYLLAVLAILPHFYSSKSPNPAAVLSPLLILAVPLADLASVVLIRVRAGKPFWIGDTNHFSHRLVRAGWSKTHAVALLWLCAAALGALSFLL
jgi:UDP-GlcNAc:undecaprenyl-phosphate/decaprenyl-phosphate GlcNAc-1-phosphate transferase